MRHNLMRELTHLVCEIPQPDGGEAMRKLTVFAAIAAVLGCSVLALAQGAAAVAAPAAAAASSGEFLTWLIAIATTGGAWVAKKIYDALDLLRTETMPAQGKEMAKISAALDKHTALTEIKFQNLEKEAAERMALVKTAADQAGRATQLAEQSALHFEAIAIRLDLTPVRSIDLNPPQPHAAFPMHRRKPHPTGG